MPEGTSIIVDGRRVALKWHRLRRRMSDPLFAGRNLEDGLRLGASLEIDLRVTGDFDFAVLHDETLEGETSGCGKVAERTRDELRQVRYLDGADPDKRGLLMLDDVLKLLNDAHPEALLQFDMKDRLETIGAAGVQQLRRELAGRKLPIIVSGDCSRLIIALRNEIPDLRRGIDPTDRLVDLFRRSDGNEAARELRRELAGPAQPDFVYLSWPLLLHARAAGLDLVAICHGKGKLVDAWTYTLCDPEQGFSDREWREFSALLDLRVDQITTDEPIATERAFAARRASG